MEKIKLSAKLSNEQIKNLISQISKVQKAYEEGSKNFVLQATQTFYDYVVMNCEVTGIYETIKNPSEKIKMEFDDQSNVGRVYTSDLVVIFNEFGTGIKGTQDEWASSHGYQVGLSGKMSWWYPTDETDGNPYKVGSGDDMKAFTQGLDSRHMFYDAFEQLKDEFKDIVEISFGEALNKNLGGLY